MATITVTEAREAVASQTFTVTEVKRAGKVKRVSEASPEVRALVKRAIAREADAARAKAEVERIKDDLKALMGDQGIDTFTWEGQNIATRSESRPERFDGAAFDEAHPGLRDTYKRASDTPEVRMTLR